MLWFMHVSGPLYIPESETSAAIAWFPKTRTPSIGEA